MVELSVLSIICEEIVAIKNTLIPYYLSRNGSIYSVKMKKYLTHSLTEHKYMRVNLVTESGKVAHYIHRLLGIYFIPNPNNLPFINHKDGNKSNNHLSNLEWCTVSENNTHGYRVLGRKANKSMRELTDKQISTIKELLNTGVTNKEISFEFGIHSCHVSRINSGQRWREIKPYTEKQIQLNIK